MEAQPYSPFDYVPAHDRPRITWPDGARVALWVIPNIEFFALDQTTPGGSGNVPDVSAWSKRDYGNRVGIFRIMEVMEKHRVRGTVALNADVCDHHPQILEAARQLDWEFMGHCQTNTRRLSDVAPGDEKALIHDTLARIERATGTRPRGWLGAGLQETWSSLEIFADEGLSYVADWVNDDQPYRMRIGGKEMVSIPYSTEINDKPAFDRSHRTADEFEAMIRRQFDVLYREGEQSGRVMAIALHPYLTGVPHRIGLLDNALDYICGHDRVWRATGAEIVEHYLGSVAED